mmetsp:Transcript_4443/g.18219  ORF Transcript_4443/g.18219 Transcript_4443/m.18219 type:complete len:247 (+) Transcript_4443:687-1427(+)
MKRGKLRERPGADGLPRCLHKLVEVEVVVDVQQHRRGHLVALQQVVHVRAHVPLARVALASGQQRPLIRPVRQRPHVALERVAPGQESPIRVLLFPILGDPLLILGDPLVPLIPILPVAPLTLLQTPGAVRRRRRLHRKRQRVPLRRALVTERRLDEVHPRFQRVQHVQGRAQARDVPRLVPRRGLDGRAQQRLAVLARGLTRAHGSNREPRQLRPVPLHYTLRARAPLPHVRAALQRREHRRPRG